MLEIVPGALFIVSAPSGAGKTSLVNLVVALLSDLQISISHTTRPPRSGETHGKDYFFVTPETFLKEVANNIFLEHATVFSHAYGTSRLWVEETLALGKDVILEIDWQGAQQVKTVYPTAESIFILPPSKESLSNRLCYRRQDAADVIATRLSMACEEIRHYNEFDYLIINDDLDEAVAALQAILLSRRLRIDAQKQRYSKLVNHLLAP